MEPQKQRLFQPGRTSIAHSLCPRLIDYIIIVGRRPNAQARRRRKPNEPNLSGGILGAPGGTVSHPEILRSYPSENHKDFVLPRDVTYFCQPEGCASFSGSAFRHLKRGNAFQEATSFVFTLTDKDTAKVRHGITLNFFLCLGNRSNEERRLQPIRSHTNVCWEQQHPPQQQQQQQQQRPSSSHAHSSAGELATTISFCMMSHHPFLSAFRDLLILFRQLVDCCNHRANQDEQLPKDAVWTVLTGHWPPGASVPNQVMLELRHLETWLFTLLSSPVPVPGKTKLLLEVLPADMMPSALEFALPDHTRFTLVDFPLHLPLELLGPDAVMQILAAIMLEYKVILQSRNYNAVSMCVLALVALLYPLDYMFPVIPLLPVFMPSAEHLLLAPTPYIIGLPASFFHCKGISVPSDVLLVDLDTNEVNMPADQTVHIPMFPQPEANILKEDFLSALGRQKGAENEADGEQQSSDADQVDVACRVAMIHFYNGPNVFGNFSEHTRTIRLYPRPVVALQVDSFLRSRGQQNNFITELCRTQAVEYFAECSLCPANETYVRVQAGVDSPRQVGDKAKWFAEWLMPVHFNAYPYGSSLSEAIFLARIDSSQQLLERISDEDEDGECPTTRTGTPSVSGNSVHQSDDLDSLGSADAGGWSPFGSRSTLNLDMSKPLSDANDVYRVPNRLELPQSDSKLSIDSSELSSGRSSPQSTVDSETDFARLANNLALKQNAGGDFTFDHSDQATEDETATISDLAEEGGQKIGSRGSLTEIDTRRMNQKQQQQMGHGERIGTALFGRPMLMDALNGYAERSQGVLSQMMRKTAPKAQALRDKAKPFAEAVGTRMEGTKVGQLLHQNRPKQEQQAAVEAERGRLQRERESAAAAQQQRKNQQQIVDVCDQVLAGQGVGLFTASKMKRLLEDESLRELVCSRLNLGLEVRYAEDEFIQDVQLSRAQFKGYLKLLQFCLAGLEQSFNTPGSNGLASAFHVLEIANTHFWTEGDVMAQGTGGEHTPGSSCSGGLQGSLQSTPSISTNNLVGTSESETVNATSSSTPTTSEPISPHEQQPANCSPIPAQMASKCELPPPGGPSSVPPPLPPRPPPPATAASVALPPTCPPAQPPPPLTRPPPLPPRRPSAIVVEIPKSDLLPPLPRRPGTAADGRTAEPNWAERKDEEIEKEKEVPAQPTERNAVPPPLEIQVKDTLERAAKGSQNQVHQPKQPPQPPAQLNLDALAEMLPSSSSGSSTVVADEVMDTIPRHFLYQDLIGKAGSANALWQKMAFWETAFLDIVAQERDKIGMDQEPAEMIDRYSQLGEAERKRLELEEDRILATLLHNMTTLMLLCHVPVRTIQQKVRRMLGKAHIGLVFSKRINQLLDELSSLQFGAKIPLKPLGSRLIQKQVFAVHEGSSPESPMCFLEICDDAIIIRAVSGAVQDRWWYERVVNMTYSPKTRVLCLWRRQDDQVHMHKFQTKKCRQLYNCLKAAMERAASRGKYQTSGRELGGEFPIHDVERNEGGLLRVRIDGVQLHFAASQELIELANIKKCNTFGGNMFILEEYDRQKGRLIQRRYISTMALSIAWALHRMFSIHLALGDYDSSAKREHLDQSAVTLYKSARHQNELRAFLPVRAPIERNGEGAGRGDGHLLSPCMTQSYHSCTATTNGALARGRQRANSMSQLRINQGLNFKGPILLPMEF